MSFSSEVKEEILNQKVWNIKSNLSEEEQLKRVYVREAFLKGGSVNDPNKDYHLEIACDTRKKVLELNEILNTFSIKSKIIKREKKYILYLKEGEEISKFLAFIGANQAVIRFEEIRVVKETRNDINRKVNCETANINKVVNAAVTQIENIKYIQKRHKFNQLTEPLKEIAQLRLENPESSLEELGKMLDPPISKSGVNHRMKKIEEFAKELKK